MDENDCALDALAENVPLSEARFTVLDTETTGLTPEDRVVEVAAVRFEFGKPSAIFSTLVNPRMPIHPEASAAHLLTARDLNGAPFMEEVEGPLREFCAHDLLVAHNMPFDRGHLPTLHERTWTCSYRFARHLWPQAPSFRNMVLRYWLGLNETYLDGVVAHRALGDALATGALFVRELLAYERRYGFGKSLKDVVQFVEGPVAVERLLYGRRHRGDRIADVPTPYLQWLVDDAESDAEQRRLNVDSDTMAAIRWELLRRRNAA